MIHAEKRIAILIVIGGRLHRLTPPKPPYMQVRTRRFSNLGPDGLEVRNTFRRWWFHHSPSPVRASPYPNPAKSTEVDRLMHDRS